MKALLEQRSKLINQMEEMLGEETRSLTEEEVSKLDEMKAEVENIDLKITQAKEVRNLKENNVLRNEEKDMEIREKLIAGQEVEMRNMTKANVKGENVQNGELVTERAKELGLKDLVRREVFNGHTVVSVQKQKMGKLAKIAELQAIDTRDILVDTVDLKPEKYALLSVVSEEVMNDSSYDVEALIRREGLEAIGETVENLVATTMNGAVGVEEVALSQVGQLTVEDLIEMFYKLPHEYRKNATWVMKSEHLKAISMLQDAVGNHFLHKSLNDDFTFSILGRPVTICEDIERIFFADLEKAVVVGVGANATVKRSDDAMFTTAGTVFRTTTYLDCKALLTKAMVKLANI